LLANELAWFLALSMKMNSYFIALVSDNCVSRADLAVYTYVSDAAVGGFATQQVTSNLFILQPSSTRLALYWNHSNN
jgi:hypothetical protein